MRRWGLGGEGRDVGEKLFRGGRLLGCGEGGLLWGGEEGVQGGKAGKGGCVGMGWQVGWLGGWITGVDWWFGGGVAAKELRVRSEEE